MIAEHVLSLGHKDIVCMFPPTLGNDRAGARRASVMRTLVAAGVTVPNAWQLETVYSISASKRDTLELLQHPKRPTAIICGNDVLATGAIYGAVAAGLSVPDDISVVGIGDFKGSAEIEPPLTTIRIPAKRIGREAGAALAAAIINPGSVPEGVHCKPSLVARSSCRRIERES